MKKNRYSDNEKVLLAAMVDWVNLQDCFWLGQFKKAFDVTGDYNDMKTNMLHRLIAELKSTNEIQCCEVDGSHRQYLRVGRIEFSKLKIGK